MESGSPEPSAGFRGYDSARIGVIGVSDIRALLAPYVTELERELRRLVPEAEGPFADLHGMLQYHLGWRNARFEPEETSSGKRVRSSLCLMAADAVGGDRRQVLPAAAAVEFLHEFSLIHDDVEDRDRERRHRKTLWVLWGDAQAINAGDALFALAQLALGALSDAGVPSSTVVEAQRRFNLTALRLCQGQHLDLAFEERDSVTADEYLAMIAGKTVALLAHAAELGALVAGGTPKQVSACHEFARQLGIAFQIQDDMLGLWGNEKETGKPVGTDVRRRKKSLPILLALAHESAAGSRLRELYARESLSEAEITDACRLIEETGARAEAEARMRDAYSASLQALETLEAADGVERVEPLRRLIHALIERKS